MDGRTLMEIMQSPNFSMWGPAEQAFNTGQDKEKANLASIMGQEQRAQQMLPLEMEQKRAAARMSNGQADIYADQLASQAPAEERKKLAMKKMVGEMDDASRAQFKAQVTRNMQIAAMAKANGGALPQGIPFTPEEVQMFSPKNLDAIIKHGETFLSFDPEEINKRKAEEARLAQVRAAGQFRVDAAGVAHPGKDGATAAVPTTPAEILAGMAKFKEARQKVAHLKSVLPLVSPELQAQMQSTYLGLVKQANAEANARVAGQVDVSGTTGGKVKVNPAVDVGGPVGAAAGRPARQAAAEAPKYSQADIEFTAKKYNMTVEQVKAKLGIK